MAGLTGQGKAIGYKKEYVGGLHKQSNDSNVGQNFRTVLEVLLDKRFVYAFHKNFTDNSKLSFFSDLRNADKDKITLALLDEIGEYGKVLTVEKIDSKSCRIHFRNGEFFYLTAFNNRILGKLFKKLTDVSEGRDLDIIKNIK